MRIRSLSVALKLMILLVSQSTLVRGVVCNSSALPSDITKHIKNEFSSWKIQEPPDLSPSARAWWEAEKPLECPGIAAGRFENANGLSYAVLLVPAGHRDAGYRFLIFSRKSRQPSYEVKVLEQWDGGGADNFLIRTVRISKFFDAQSRKRFDAQTIEGILLVDSAEKEYGVDVYFWSNGSYKHESLDY
jgi:hypothetical protein